MKLVLIAFLFVPFVSFAQTKVAVVSKLRGEVEVTSLGKTVKLKAEDWVEDGAVIKTGERSFVQLKFIDKSQMNIGPASEMRIEKFAGKDSGVIDLVKGKIRSQVSKDYLQIKDQDKSKLFIKTPNAVMGIRGTDFMISTNGANTAAVLFEGEVVFNKLDNREEVSTSNLESIVDKGVRIHPGEFSVMDANRPEPTVPSLLNVQQKEALEKNQEFDSDRSTASGKEEVKKSVVPEGLSGQVVSNTTETIKKEVTTTAGVIEPPRPAAQQGSPSGFVQGDTVKPANGSFVHIESGVIIPPPPGSVLDPNTNSFIPPKEAGQVSSDGSYIPPKNVEITNDGKILVAIPDTKSGGTKVMEVPKPAPVVATTTANIGAAAHSGTQTVVVAPPPMPKNDILNAQFTPSGLNDLSNFQRNTSGGIQSVNDAAIVKPTADVHIRVNP
ncbi:MAG: FecR domain-containing protein [Bacteriovoracaceae bacterium]